MRTHTRALATLNRPTATSVQAGEQITGEVIASKGRDVKAILCSSRPGRDGITLDIAGATYRRGVRELPLLIGHDLRSLPIGRVVDIHPERRDGFDVLVGTLRFGSSLRAREAEADVRAGVTTDVSVGFDIPKGGRDWTTGRARSFQLTECSLVPVGMDESTIIFERSYHGRRGAPLELDDEQETTMDYADVEPAELKRAVCELLVRMGIGFQVRGEQVGWTRDSDPDYERAYATGESEEDDGDYDEDVDDEDDEDAEVDEDDEDLEDEDMEDDDEDMDEDEAGERGYEPELTRAMPAVVDASEVESVLAAFSLAAA